MGRYIVGYEGRDTADGRLIEVGAVTPQSGRLPVLFEFRYDMDSMGWAEDFGRRLNEDTGFTEISFEIMFKGEWEQKVLTHKLTPTCMMVSPLARVPYDQPEELGKTIISSAEINAVGFSVGPNAWGEYPK